MNAHALLSAQGWRGTGHSLHKTDDSIGLAKPLLLNRKDNKKGLGQTQHFTSDQWWMNAFDEQLKGLDTSKEGKVVQTVKTGKLNALDKGALAKYSVYATFVRGGFLEGTITPELTDGSSVSDTLDEEKEPNKDKAQTKKDGKEDRETRRKEREDRDKRKNKKEEKRRRKEGKAARKAARAVRREERAAKREEKLRRRARKEKRRSRKTEGSSK